MRLPLLIFAASLLLGAAPEPAFRVIVNEQRAVTTLPKATVAAFFLKKSSTWPDGATAQPVDLTADAPARRAFSEAVLGRSVTAVRAYWQQRIFSGRELPPPEKGSDAEVIAFVRANPQAIGYVSASAELSGVRALTLVEKE